MICEFLDWQIVKREYQIDQPTALDIPVATKKFFK